MLYESTVIGCAIFAIVGHIYYRFTGQEVASYWYSTVRRYNYFKDNGLLHTNVNAGHFTQMVWVKSKIFGIGKAMSKTGKIFVVAYYYPAGETTNYIFAVLLLCVLHILRCGTVICVIIYCFLINILESFFSFVQAML